MRRLAIVLALALALALALGLPASAHAPGAAEPGRAGVRPGEAFTFQFSVGPIESGRARMSVGPEIEHGGQRLIAVHGQAETASWLQLLVRLDDEYKLVLDAATLLPVEVETIERGIRNRRFESKLRGREAEIAITEPAAEGKAPNRRRGRRLLPGPVRDPLCALFMLRTLALASGDQLVLDVLDGAALWRVRLTAQKGERLRLEHEEESAQSRGAIRIDGLLTRIDDSGRPTAGARVRHLKVWLSDDPDRVLLRAEADTDLGPASLELTGYTPPRRSRSRK